MAASPSPATAPTPRPPTRAAPLAARACHGTPPAGGSLPVWMPKASRSCLTAAPERTQPGSRERDQEPRLTGGGEVARHREPQPGARRAGNAGQRKSAKSPIDPLRGWRRNNTGALSDAPEESARGRRRPAPIRASPTTNSLGIPGSSTSRAVRSGPSLLPREPCRPRASILAPSMIPATTEWSSLEESPTARHSSTTRGR